MLRRYRRYFGLLVALMLAIPLFASLMLPQDAGVSADELRPLAPVPTFPRTAADWLLVPRQLDAYFQDHFGFRRTLIHAEALLRYYFLHSGNDFVFIGRNGWLFFKFDYLITQSAGIARHDYWTTQTTNMLQGMHRVLARKGVRFLVASPPNSATIYGDQLPKWAQNNGRLTDYDVFLEQLAAKDVPALDLRPILKAARDTGRVYHLHDTHWTARGAIAGFNAVASEMGHADWRLDSTAALGPLLAEDGGDLARMLGLQGDLTENDQNLDMPPWFGRAIEPGDYVASGRDPTGPVLLIVGDSFTDQLFAPMVLPHVRQLVWLHHKHCDLDWQWVEKFRPDEVWWMPTERFLYCWAGLKPHNFIDPSPIATK